jgi:signal transduction histidine kinase
VSVLLARLATPVTVEGVQAVLRDALGDSTAAVFYRLPEGTGLISATGEPVAEPAEADLTDGLGFRGIFSVEGQDGEVAALLTVDSSGGIDPDRVELALTACRPALENARLQAILRSQLREAEASRARIVGAALEERRKLARDLHDGAQQHLHALSANLALARQKAAYPEAVATIDAASKQLRVAIGRLRGLGRDLYPSVLEAEGLPAALESLADEGPLDTDMNARAGRLTPEVEIVMYLTVRELLDGLAGRCAASHAAVTVSAGSDRLSAAVASDGRLGDGDPVPMWLSVIRDRIHAVGGDMSIRPGPAPAAAQAGRIWIEAWIPCA